MTGETGTKKCMRMSNRPRPAIGGKDCAGPSHESRSCQGLPCPGTHISTPEINTQSDD